MTHQSGSRLLRDGIAVLWVIAAAVATWAVWPDLEPTVTPLFLVAIAVSGWIGGLRGGIIAAVLSIILNLFLSVKLGWHGDLGFAGFTWACSFLLVALLTGALNSARQRAEQLLYERDQRMRLISDQIPAGLWSTDTELHITSMFGAALPLISANPSHAVRLSDVFGESSSDCGAAAEIAHRTALQGQAASFESVLHGRVCQSHVEPLHSADGSVIGVVGVALDITEHKRAQEQLKVAWDQATRAKQDAEAANSAKDRFLAMLSHELRTPLTPALVAAAALEKSNELPPQVLEDVAMIRRNIELEAILIDDLLDLTRVARGKLELTFRPTNAHDVLWRAVNICRADCQEKGIELITDLSADHTGVLADAARLQQIFWNLIKNAVKFTPPGGKVTVRSRTEDERNLVIEVTDTGIGMDEDVLPKVFDAFEQGPSTITRDFGGLGLGLAISKSLVEAHGGKIWATSAGKGQGSAFFVRLQTAPQRVEVTIPQRPAGLSEARKPLKILLVEDHADTRRLMSRLLGRMGYDIRTAGSVQSALEEFDVEPVELLVADIALPDGTGLDLMRSLRQRDPGGRVRGIALSGYGMEDDIRRCREAGFAKHLTKPIKMDVLEEAIQQVSSK